ncbi:Lrp/AsnC family transcriptional regulator [Acrocarpospora catenulata]|uniref:Lrp/AsnC family transcriptional regulator n=1 Tax=Acrocarpospora catenulata TaxID=2836182 RepID=UPI0027E165B8|nr:Lrp/AsnC family transcriptional regulator [Acrocarpospora catenulata]
MIALDATDRTILRELQRDGRMSYAALGEAVGLSAPAARQRVQRLTEAKVLQVVGITDPLVLGWPAMAMLGVRTSGDPRAVADALGELTEVIYVVLTAGSFQLFAEVVCASTGDLLNLVEDRVRTVDGVSGVETFPYFALHTHRFTWDIP